MYRYEPYRSLYLPKTNNRTDPNFSETAHVHRSIFFFFVYNIWNWRNFVNIVLFLSMCKSTVINVIYAKFLIVLFYFPKWTDEIWNCRNETGSGKLTLSSSHKHTLTFRLKCAHWNKQSLTSSRALESKVEKTHLEYGM